MIHEVHTDRVTYNSTPAKFEAGTPNVGGAVGLSAALDYLTSLGWEEVRSHEQHLLRTAVGLAKEEFGDSLTIFGPREPSDRHAVISFQLKGIHPHDLASILDERGICIRAGHHCAQPLMERLGVSALTRASPYVYNTEGEIRRLFDALLDAAKLFKIPIAQRTTAS